MARLTGRDDDRRRLHALAARLRRGLAAAGFRTAGDSPVMPLITGSNALAVRLSDYLQEHGFFVLPIRTPTVPAGGERLRFSLTTAVTEEQIDRIIALCKAFGA